MKKKLTYQDLKNYMALLKPEELAQYVSINLTGMDEYFELNGVRTETETDVLDKGHFVLVVNN